MITEHSYSLTGEVRSPVATSAAEDRELASHSPIRHDWQEAWQHLIDDRLIDWGLNPSRFEDDGLEPPTASAIKGAIKLCSSMCEKGEMPPTRVVPSGEGGIVFELSEGLLFLALEIFDERSAELRVFKDSRLIHQRRLSI